MDTLHNHKHHALPSFDELMRMAKNDPEAFEQFRKDKARELIENASKAMRPRLWALQSHIDRVIDSGKNPHHVNVLLMNELQKQVIKLNDALQGNPQPKQTRNVVQFQSRKNGE